MATRSSVAGLTLGKHVGLPQLKRLAGVRRRSLVTKCLNGLATAPANQAYASRPTYSASSGLGSAKTLSSADLQDEQPRIAYELIQGPLARWSTKAPGQAPPTAVLVHGILGSRRNMQSFARLLVDNFPAWQILLVDLRCHGESAALDTLPSGPHNVDTAAADVLAVLRDLRLFPHTLIGHSFGGKVVMSMARQFGGTRLPRPVQVWVLDSLPGEVRAGDAAGRDRPADLIATLRAMPQPLASRNAVVEALEARGFSSHIARWAATNLRPAGPGSSHLTWSFDLDGIADMYSSYEESELWPLLERPPEGLRVDFVKAEGSTFRWGGPDEERIRAHGHGVHLLENSGHWVHTDNPYGLFDILAPSLGGLAGMNRSRSTSRSPSLELH